MSRVEELYKQNESNFKHWEVVQDCIDQCIDLMLNWRQSGHPGGSRSKVHVMVATLLGGVMRWDIRRPDSRFGDRYVLVAGHTVPLVYATLAVLNEAMRTKHKETGDAKYAIHNFDERALTWEDLLGFRRNKGLAGHAEMEGKTLFLKFNTGPSGHGSPPAAGEALALKRAGAEDVRVFAFEGEGGHTTGATHETKNTAYGLRLSNLVYVVDWNDFGIDDNPISSVVHGSPKEWFEPYGFRVFGADPGSEFAPVTRALLNAVHGDNPDHRPNCVYVKTRKGRGYLKYDNKSHGSPHKANSELFWDTKKEFADKYGVQFQGFGEPLPEDFGAQREQMIANYNVILDVLRKRPETLDYVANRLAEIGDSVPREIDGFRLPEVKNPANDSSLFDYETYPKEMWAKPGDKKPNRAGLSTWGAWINTVSKQKYGRPLFLACSADLADSTNISGFSKGFGGEEGYGWFKPGENEEGILMPQMITEFTNAGLMIGAATVNMSTEPEKSFNGFYTACSTYGSFSYLKYGPMRLFSQLAQDCELKVGKVLWIAGHSGPETADDSRTHFGIFAPGVTDLFPNGHVVNLHPWEYNEVPVMLGAAFAGKWPIVALHLTRPPVEIPDRAALGMGSHFEAAKGAYIMRAYDKSKPKMGTLIVQGTSTTANVVKLLPELDKAGLNVKLVAAPSYELFQAQTESYRNTILPPEDFVDSTVISNRSKLLARSWFPHRTAEEYAITSDWDDRWRTGGTLDEVIEEAHLSEPWILKGIERFAKDREKRLNRIRATVEAALGE